MGDFSSVTGLKATEIQQNQEVVGYEPLVTVEEMVEVLPKGASKAAKQGIVDKINQIQLDPDFREQYRDNLISYTHVVKTGKYRAEQYFDACRYVSFKMMGLTNEEAWGKTFPDRLQRLNDNGASKKDLSAHVAMYNKSKLVNLILEQSVIPMHILNRDAYQEAIDTQVELMRHADSEKVRTDAANSILNHLKAPESTKIELDVGLKESQSIDNLTNAIEKLREEQKKALHNGTVTLEDVAEGEIIDVEAERIDGS